jgi:hypothetical protein
MNIRLHPVLAEAISLAITQRSLAAEMINTAILGAVYNHEDFVFWRDKHVEASQKLAAFGIDVITYVNDANAVGAI